MSDYDDHSPSYSLKTHTSSVRGEKKQVVAYQHPKQKDFSELHTYSKPDFILGGLRGARVGGVHSGYLEIST